MIVYILFFGFLALLYLAPIKVGISILIGLYLVIEFLKFEAKDIK